MKSRTFAMLVPLLVLALAGCVQESDEGAVTPQSIDDPDAILIRGTVVDDEFFPVSNATVGLDPLERITTTNPDGSFVIGPVEPYQEITIWAEADGYKGQALNLNIEDVSINDVLISILRISDNVPYHATDPHVAFIECAWGVSIFLGTSPCNPVERNTNAGIFPDESQRLFEIPSPNLVSMSFEASWNGNVLGRDMRFILLIPDVVGSNYATGDPMLDGRGGSPYVTWLVHGEEGERASQAFIGNESTPYQMLYRPWTTNSTSGVAVVYINHRVDSFYTFWYHADGPRDFRAIPDE